MRDGNKKDEKEWKTQVEKLGIAAGDRETSLACVTVEKV
jgi:hypothetical protein